MPKRVCQQYLNSPKVAGSISAVQGISTVIALQALLLTTPPHLPLLVPAGTTPAHNTAVAVNIPFLTLLLLVLAEKKTAYITAKVVLLTIFTIAMIKT